MLYRMRTITRWEVVTTQTMMRSMTTSPRARVEMAVNQAVEGAWRKK